MTDIMDRARELRQRVNWSSNEAVQQIADAILEAERRGAERQRERDIASCEAQRASFASDEYATPQPLGGLMERFACDQCIAAIRNQEASQ